MTVEDIAERLPVHIPMEALHECQRRAKNDLGGNFLIFKRVSYLPENSFVGYMGFDDDDAVKARWASECRCTACGGKFHLGWKSETVHDYGKTYPRYGVLIPEGPDGGMYAFPPDEVYAFPPDEVSEFTTLYRDGDTTRCPECDTDVTVKHASYFRSYGGCQSLAWRVMFGTVHNIDRCTTLVFWLITRTVARDADVTTQAEPMYAVAVNDNQRLSYFRFDAGWKSVHPVDPCQRIYHSTDAVCNRKIGAFFSRSIPNQAGMSAEKTGLADYLDQGGYYPVLYLKFQYVCPYIENLVKSGWTYSIDSAIATQVNTARMGGRYVTFPDELHQLPMKWTSPAPCDMLGMSRVEVRHFASEAWESSILELWLRCAAAGLFKPGQVSVFWEAVGTYGVACLDEWRCLCTNGHAVSLDAVNRYLSKQKQKNGIASETGFRLFVDYRKMLYQVQDVTGIHAADNIELFPADLRAAHDRVAVQVKQLAGTLHNQKFQRLKELWKDLEFSDGAICTRLPRSEADLISEGHTLHHCVGSYGKDHLAGKLIIFIRHARRPERSWYTLNIDTTGTAPRRIQLHGYGNEFAHGRTLHIPQAVFDFCDKWEKDVLLPVFAKVKSAR